MASLKKLSPVWTHMSDIVVDSAKGSWLFGQNGKKYLDFTCGIGVTNTGHCHPKVVEAIRDQAGKVIHAQANIVYHQPMLGLVDRLSKIVPKELDTFFFSNSGAEAVEASIKLARHYTGRTNVITFQGSFHGRTIGTMSLTNSKTVYRVGYQPLMSGVHVNPFPYCHRCRCRPSSGDCCEGPLEDLEIMFKQQCAPQETAAILVEPILGEGGYVVPPTSFLRSLRALCDKYGIMLIADEVQTGFGRTGKFFAIEHFDVVPDILIMAKGIASGLPLSGIASRAEIMAKWVPGSHGGTYGGNAVACAAANATIDAMISEKMIENAQARGEQLKSGLAQIQKKYDSAIGDVRGLGLMVGVEFNDKKMPYGIASQVSKQCLSNGMLVLTASIYDTLRIIPPLNVSEDEVKQGLSILDKSIGEVLAAKH